MLSHSFIAQPSGGASYLSLFSQALRSAKFDHLDIAVAYATSNGARDLLDHCRAAAQEWPEIEKRWLVGIDYCRTEPMAIDVLSSERRSSVKIHDGANLIRTRCFPSRTFHPKAFIFRSDNAIGILSGSGNLSRNGLNRGHEFGNLILVEGPLSIEDAHLRTAWDGINAWFEDLWVSATDTRTVLPAYRRIYQSVENRLRPTPTDDDVGSTTSFTAVQGARQFSAEFFRKLRVCTALWIREGTLTKNRGKKLPGNQTMLSRMTRVFFGFPAEDVDKDTTIGHIDIRFQNNLRRNCTLSYSNNGMDKLNLPIPGQDGPERYDNEILLFEKLADGTFSLSIATAQEADLSRRSLEIDALYHMRGGRPWGVF